MGSRLLHPKPVGIPLPGPDGVLGESGHPVFPVGDIHPVPVDRDPVFDILVDQGHFHEFPLPSAQLGARHLPVEGPGLYRFSGGEANGFFPRHEGIAAIRFTGAGTGQLRHADRFFPGSVMILAGILDVPVSDGRTTSVIDLCMVHHLRRSGSLLACMERTNKPPPATATPAVTATSRIRRNPGEGDFASRRGPFRRR